MKPTTKRYIAREVMWLLISLGIFLVFMLIEWQVGKHYNPLTGNVIHHPQGFIFDEYDWRKKEAIQDQIGYVFIAYLVLIYPLRYIIYAAKWSYNILHRDSNHN